MAEKKKKFEVKNEGTGFLWVNKNKQEGDKQPDYSGLAKIDGEQKQVAIWVNYNEYDEIDNLSLSIKDEYVPEEKTKPKRKL